MDVCTLLMLSQRCLDDGNGVSLGLSACLSAALESAKSGEIHITQSGIILAALSGGHCYRQSICQRFERNPSGSAGAVVSSPAQAVSARNS